MPSFNLLRKPLFAIVAALLLLAPAVVAVPASALAQTPAPQEAAPPPAADAAPVSELDTARKDIAAARKSLDALKQSVEASRDDDMHLVELRAQVEEIASGAVGISAGLRPRFDAVRARLTELGDPPQAGQPPEADVVREERNKLVAERGELNAVTGEAENVSVSARQLSNTITAIRRALFTDMLFRRTELSTALLGDAWESIGTEVSTFVGTLSSWMAFVWKFKRLQFLTAIFLSLAATLFLLIASSRLFGAYISHANYPGEPGYLRRLSVAFWSTMTRSLTVCAFLLVSAFLLQSFNVLRPDIAPIVFTAMSFVALIYFIWRLTHGVFAPGNPEWRLVRVSDKGARTLSWSVLAMAVVNGLDYLLTGISEALNSPVVLTVAKSFIASVIIGVILIAMSFLRPVAPAEGEEAMEAKPWPKWFASLLRFLGLVLILTCFAGYVGLARFVSTQIVLTSAVLATMYIGILSGRAISEQGVFGSTIAGKFLGRRFNLGDIALDQTGLFVGLGIYACAGLFGIPLVLLSWGFKTGDIEQWLYRAFTGITVGSMSISLVGILGGIMVFVVGYVLTRWFQKWLDGTVMARGHVDAGVRNSVRTGIGYVGVAAAAIFGISSAGLDLSSLALVASALSVGIGFGLQNIVSNFVSGLILLVERPFKVGDWVVTGTTEGTVKRLSVRATEIETFRGQSIIVPNSQFINSSVGNWTHRNRTARSEIQVGVSYDADPRRVMELLLEMVRAQPLVLRTPEPQVEFLRFGDSSLDFELRFHLADLSNGLKVRNDLRIEIFNRFKEEGIEIPFPQRNLNVQVNSGNPALVGALLEGEGDHVTFVEPTASKQAEPEKTGGPEPAKKAERKS